MYSGLSLTGGSIEFTPLLNSGLSRTGGRIKLPLSSTGVLVETGPVYSGFSFIFKSGLSGELGSLGLDINGVLIEINLSVNCFSLVPLFFHQLYN